MTLKRFFLLKTKHKKREAMDMRKYYIEKSKVKRKRILFNIKLYFCVIAAILLVALIVWAMITVFCFGARARW